MSAIFELQTFNNTNNTDNTTHTMTKKLIPINVEQQNPTWWDNVGASYVPMATHYKLLEFDNGYLLLVRFENPTYSVPIIKDDAGQYHFDRDNIQWLDDEPPTAEQAADIIEKEDTTETLQYLVDNLKPCHYIKENE